MAARGTIVDQLSAILLKNKSISEKDAQELQKAFHDSARDNFCDFLVEEGFVQEEDILRALSRYYQVPPFDTRGYFFDHFLLRKFPEEFLVRNAVIPLEVDEDILVVVAADPTIEGLESEIRSFVSYDIDFYVGLGRDIIDAIEEYYDKPPLQENEEQSLDEEIREEKEAIEHDEERKELSYGDVIYKDDEDPWRD